MQDSSTSLNYSTIGSSQTGSGTQREQLKQFYTNLKDSKLTPSYTAASGVGTTATTTSATTNKTYDVWK